ncbi:MAG: sigma-70 family RNA polymerase sigma factor [Clostridiaceae bacterium]|nr:sigma-70 family RNA polymerase sigma factor [Clostridiaceae bacterium]
MAQYRTWIDYRKKYPGLSDEIVKALQKSDRKIEYQQYDLKVDRYKTDRVTGAITRIPSREVSYDMLLEANKQFQSESESVEDQAVTAVMIERMMACFRTLPLEERSLIRELFFRNKSERQLSAETGIPQMTLHYRKSKILKKLRKLLEK